MLSTRKLCATSMGPPLSSLGPQSSQHPCPGTLWGWETEEECSSAQIHHPHYSERRDSSGFSAKRCWTPRAQVLLRGWAEWKTHWKRHQH